MTASVTDPTTSSRALAQPGKYSIERMLALEEYTRTKSIWHVLAVLLVTPVLPFAVIVAFELPPLQPVEAGWRANWVFMIWRLGGSMVIVSEGALMIGLHIMPELKAVLGVRVRVFIALASALAFIIPTAVIAEVWGFPVPFTVLLANPTGGSGFFAALFVAVRSVALANEETKRRLLFLSCYLSTVPVMATVYPAYIALFEYVGRNNQPFVMLLVPVIKIVFRKAITRITAEWEDLVPIAVIFSIELFNSLYLVICVQSGGSALTTMAVMAIDLAHTARSVWRLNKSTKKLQQLLKEAHKDTLLSRVCALCDDAAAFHASTQAGKSPQHHLLRVKSSLSHCGLSKVGRTRLASIEKIGVFSSGQQIQPAPSAISRTSFSFPFFNPTKVSPGENSTQQIPVHASRQPSSTNASTAGDSDAHAKQIDAIVEAATMLFRSEYLLLGEYLECVIPWIYATNLVVLWTSPNGVFYPHTRAIVASHDLVSILFNVGAFLAFEIATLVILSVVLWKWLKFSPLHQLGYILEHQAGVIQTQMTVLLVMSLQFNLDHVGADFSFQFKWLH